MVRRGGSDQPARSVVVTDFDGDPVRLDNGERWRSGAKAFRSTADRSAMQTVLRPVPAFSELERVGWPRPNAAADGGDVRRRRSHGC
jgi:hypothetical protein